jgi:hypothetical protein
MSLGDGFTLQHLQTDLATVRANPQWGQGGFSNTVEYYDTLKDGLKLLALSQFGSFVQNSSVFQNLWTDFENHMNHYEQVGLVGGSHDINIYHSQCYPTG